MTIYGRVLTVLLWAGVHVAIASKWAVGGDRAAVLAYAWIGLMGRLYGLSPSAAQAGAELMAEIGPIEVDVIAIMPRCRDCRWWKQHEEAMFGDCQLAEASPPSRFWAGAECAVVTQDDFGCVQWQERH